MTDHVRSLRHLDSRVRQLTLTTRSLWRKPAAVEAVIDVGDDLLADLDVALTLILEEQGPRWERLADRALLLKRTAYGEIVAFLRVREPRLGEILERSMQQDLTDSVERILVCVPSLRAA